MSFTRRGRRREALATPFPEEWRQLLTDRVAHWRMLDDTEREKLEEFIRIILVDKYWEASAGFTLTDEIKVTISAMACLLILGLDYDYYHKVTSIIVSPTAVVQPGQRPVGDGLFSDEPMDVLGFASYNGPVLIAWDEAQENARHAERGHNVVYHEFAHKLDMLDGSVDGTPPLDTRAQYARWTNVGNAEYDLIRSGNGGDLLRSYGGVNPAEFFAVITEVFFDKPVEMHHKKPELYEMLRDFYNQDPAARQRRAEGG